MISSWKHLTDRWFKWTLFLRPPFDHSNYRDLIPTKREFSNINIKGDVLFRIMTCIFIRLGITVLSAVTEMTIISTTMQLLDFNNIMKMFPNLKTVELSAVMCPLFAHQHLSGEDTPIFQQLRQLYFGHDTDYRFLQCFRNSKLETFVCREQNYPEPAIRQFLSTQHDCQTIDFCRIASNAFFSFDVHTSTTFTLKRIALDYKEISDFDGITELLLFQPNNFEVVEFGHIPVLPVMSTIFTNLNNLKTLHMMPGSVAQYLRNGLLLQPLLSVTNLRLYDGVNYGLHPTSIEEMTVKVIENLPNLVDLELFVPYKQIYYQSITMNLKKLTSLTIRVTFDTKLRNLKFPSVEKLRINCFNHGLGRSRHPSISMVGDGEVKEILPDVRSLAYEGHTNVEFFDFVRSTFPKLESLDVRKGFAQCEHASIMGIRGVHYRDGNYFSQRMRFN